MPVEGVFTIEGRGTVVTGRVARGVLEVGATVEIVGKADAIVVTGIESFHKKLVEARAGQNVGLLLRGVARDAARSGEVITAPGAIAAHGAGDAEVYVLGSKEGGRHTSFGTGYAPQFFFGATHVTGVVTTNEDARVEPGARASSASSSCAPSASSPACASLSAKAAKRSAPAWSRPSGNDEGVRR